MLPTIYKENIKKETKYDEIYLRFKLPNNKKIIFYPAQFWAHKNHKYINILCNFRAVIPMYKNKLINIT